MFGASPSELTAADIYRVVNEGVQEGAEAELKSALPSKKGDDPWIKGTGSIGDYARNKIIAEIIAFANAYGGWLLLGIEETKDKPSRAKAVTPIPNCTELAERLRLQCRDCIEPQIPLLEVAGIPTNDDGAGVVAFHVPQSRMGPHRHSATRECYIRRADRTEEMTMREIQDLTLQVDRGIAAIDAAFNKHHINFIDYFGDLCLASSTAFGIRATLIPMSPIQIGRAHNNDAAHPINTTISGKFGGKDSFELFVPISFGVPHPIIRGSRFSGQEIGSVYQVEVNDNGLIEYQLYTWSNDFDPDICLYVQWVMGLVANAMCTAEKLRVAADATGIEYALEVEVVTTGHSVPVGLYGRNAPGFRQKPFPNGETLFPRYSLGPRKEFTLLAALIERDFWDAVGTATDSDLEVDFESVFQVIDQKF